jgi:hypothetical protein
MPFKSEAQRKFMYAKHPEIAERWSKKYKTPANLPKHIRIKAVEMLKKRGK